MAKTSESKAVAEAPKGGAVATYNYGEDAGAGFEKVTANDLLVPFFQVLQSNSPQVEDNNPPGSKAGGLFNSVTKDLYDPEKGIVVQPVHKDVVFIEWKPRDNGGGKGKGFVAIHQVDSEIVKKAIAAKGQGHRVFGKLEHNGNELVETKSIYCQLLDEAGKDTIGFGVLGFTSTKIKPHNQFITSMKMVKGAPPMFAFRAVVRTVKEKNEKGTFFNFAVSPFGADWRACLIDPSTDEGKALILSGKEFRDMVLNGIAKADFASQDGEAGDASTKDAPF